MTDYLREKRVIRYYIDTEFIEYPHTIDLISIGIVSEDNRMFYAENMDCDFSKANDFVREKVIPNLYLEKFGDDGYNGKNNLDTVYDCKEAIKYSILDFISEYCCHPEFWGYYCAYDWVVFCWLFGSMADLPKGWPMYCRDLKQYSDMIGAPKYGVKCETHNALDDAKWNKSFHDYLMRHDDEKRRDHRSSKR